MKKRVLLLLAVTAYVFASCSGDGQVRVRMAHTGSEGTLAHQAFLVIKEHMERESNGAFIVDIFPAGQLGNDAQLVESVQEGDIHLMFTNTGNLLSFVPELGVFAVPFAFPSIDVAYRVLDGPFGREMLEMMERRGHMVGLSYLEAVSYRELSANRPVATLEDLAGLKIRVMTNPIHIAIWESLGALPTPISFAELYTALQQGTVDAQENPLELFIAQRFFEVNRFVTLTHHIFTTGMFVANPAWFNGLSPELQQIVRDAAIQGMLFQRQRAAEEYETYLQTLEAGGVTITALSESEAARWRQQVLPVNNMIAQQIGGQALIDRLFSAVEAAQD